MSKKELLEYAVKNYPIGTEFYSPIPVCEKEFQIADGNPYFYMVDSDNIAVKNSKGVIYWNGKWAKIISSPKLKEIYYEIY